MTAGRTSVVAVGFALVLAACTGSDAAVQSSTASVQTNSGAAESTTSAAITPSTSTAANAPEPGEWVKTVFAEDQHIQDFVMTADGRLLGLLYETSGRFRVVELGADGGWTKATDWVVQSIAGINDVAWSSLTVFKGFYLVAGSVQLPADGPHVTPVPVFARVDVATGETTIEFDRDNPDKGNVADATVFGNKLVAVGEAPNGRHDWGPGIWLSDDGLIWERSETPPEVAGVVYQLTMVVESGGLVVSVGQNNEGTDPPYVLWSTNGVDWEAAVLPQVAEGERIRLSGVVHDGSEFVIVGSSDSGEALWRSVDGLGWVRDETDPTVFGDGDVSTNRVWGANGVVLVSGEGVHRESILYCVDDPSTCRQHFSALWLRSGSTWQRLVPPSDQWTDAVAMINQRIATAGLVEEAGAVWAWAPAGDGLLPIAHPFDLSPPVSDVPQLGDDPVIKEGTAYVVPLSEACPGPSYLGYINGVHWLLEDGPLVFSSDWPVMIGHTEGPEARTVFGTIQLVAPDRIEYSVDGFGVVAVYVPAAEGYEPHICF